MGETEGAGRCEQERLRQQVAAPAPVSLQQSHRSQSIWSKHEGGMAVIAANDKGFSWEVLLDVYVCSFLLNFCVLCVFLIKSQRDLPNINKSTWHFLGCQSFFFKLA